MGWRLLSWLWGDAAPAFVRASAARSVVAVATIRTIYANESSGMIRAFGPKDPDEVDWINFDFTMRLAKYGDTLASVVGVALTEGDAALLVDQVTMANGIVSARWRAGTLESSYTLRARVTTAAGRTWDLSGSVFIAEA